MTLDTSKGPETISTFQELEEHVGKKVSFQPVLADRSGGVQEDTRYGRLTGTLEQEGDFFRVNFEIPGSVSGWQRITPKSFDTQEPRIEE